MRHLRLSLLVIAAVNVGPASANMENIFNGMYNATPPNFEQQGNGRYGVSLGSFSYRPEVSQVSNVVAARLPNFNMDACGNIDMFAGSFSFISGDELSQMARGIMQGAATYAFDLALNSISPLAGEIKSNLTEMINQMNRFSKDSCQMGRNMMDNTFGEITSTAGTESQYFGETIKDFSETVGNFADTFDKQTTPKGASENAAEAGINAEFNSTKAALDAQGVRGSFFDEYSGIPKNELVMNIVGSTITSAKGTSNCTAAIENGEASCLVSITPMGAEAFLNLFYDTQDMNNTDPYDFTYQKCANADCTELSEVTVQTTRLLPLLRTDIGALWDSVVNGTVELSDRQQKLNYYLGNTMIANMRAFGKGGSVKESYINLNAPLMMSVMLDHIAQDLIIKTRESLIKQKSDNSIATIIMPGLNSSLLSLENFQSDYNTAYKEKISQHIDQIKKDYAMAINLFKVK